MAASFANCLKQLHKYLPKLKRLTQGRNGFIYTDSAHKIEVAFDYYCTFDYTQSKAAREAARTKMVKTCYPHQIRIYDSNCPTRFKARYYKRLKSGEFNWETIATGYQRVVNEIAVYEAELKDRQREQRERAKATNDLHESFAALRKHKLYNNKYLGKGFDIATKYYNEEPCVTFRIQDGELTPTEARQLVDFYQTILTTRKHKNTPRK